MRSPDIRDGSGRDAAGGPSEFRSVEASTPTAARIDPEAIIPAAERVGQARTAVRARAPRAWALMRRPKPDRRSHPARRPGIDSHSAPPTAADCTSGETPWSAHRPSPPSGELLVPVVGRPALQSGLAAGQETVPPPVTCFGVVDGTSEGRRPVDPADRRSEAEAEHNVVERIAIRLRDESPACPGSRRR